MAILNSIRKKGIFLVIIIAMALFAFIISGIIGNNGLSTQTSQSTIATINGTDIDRVAFMQQVENVKQQMGPTATVSQALNYVWENELRSTLLSEQYEALGITAENEFTKDALSKAFATDPTFLTNGVFDENKLQEYIAIQKENPQAYAFWLDRERNVINAALEQTYFNMVKAGMGATLSEGELDYRLANNKVDIQFVQVPYSKIANDQVTVSEEEIITYMRTHEDEFTVEPEVDVQYVLFAEEPSAQDDADIKKIVTDFLTAENGFNTTNDIKAYVTTNSDYPYNENYLFKDKVPTSIADTLFALPVGATYGPYKVGDTYSISKIMGVKQIPDSVKARHILISYAGLPSATAEVTKTEEQAKITADSILNVLKRDRSKFAELVTSFSADKASIEKGGTYDWFTYNAMVAEFRDYCFDNKTGDLGVVKTDFGFHIIEIEGQTNKQKTIQLATVSKTVTPTEKTLSDLFTETTMFEMNAAKGDFAELAAESSYGIRPVNNIGKMDDNIPGVGNNRRIITWAFNEETNIGDINRFDIQNGYVIAQLTRRNSKKALMSVAEASPRVTPILRKEKKAKLIREAISGTTLEDVAQNQNQTVNTASALTLKSPTIAGAGTEPKVVGTAFGLKAGQTSKLIDGVNGIYMIRVTTINEAVTLNDYSTFSDQLYAQKAGQVNGAVYSALKKAATIEDNRSVFY